MSKSVEQELKQIKVREKHKQAIADDVYEEILQYLGGESIKPVKMRTNRDKSGYTVLYEKRFSSRIVNDPVKGKDVMRIILNCNSKSVVRNSEVSEIIDFFYMKQKGVGAKKLAAEISTHYTGIGEKLIQKHINKKEIHRRMNPRFKNKGPLTPITAKCVQERHQIDLADFSRNPKTVGDVTYKYILSIMDVFSRFLWLRPLSEKSADAVAKHLKLIYLEFGPPAIIQSDQGGEFKGAVRLLCEELQIKIIRSSPRHPQSQGKIERSHGTWKSKLRFDMLKEKKDDIDWVERLPEYAALYNIEVHSSFQGKLSPFKVFYGRASNRGVLSSSSPTVSEEVIDPTDFDFEQEDHSSALHEEAITLSTKTADKMVKYNLAKNPPVCYDIGQTVLARLKTAKRKKCDGRLKRASLVTKAVVVDYNRQKHLYKVVYPEADVEKVSWISVCNITSETAIEEQQREARSQDQPENLKMDYVKALEHFTVLHSITNCKTSSRETLESAAFARGYVVQDVPRDGNCLFSSVSEQLKRFEQTISPYTLRQMSVSYLTKNPVLSDGTPLDAFLDEETWQAYLNRMSKDGEWGDHIVLTALAEVMKRTIIILSGNDSITEIRIEPSAKSVDNNATITLGHISEVHYVSLIRPSRVESVDSETSGSEQKAVTPDNISILPNGLSQPPYGPLRKFVPEKYWCYAPADLLESCVVNCGKDEDILEESFPGKFQSFIVTKFKDRAYNVNLDDMGSKARPKCI